MEHTYNFSADTNRLDQFLRDGKKIIIWHGAEDTLISHIDSARAHEAMVARTGQDSDNARLFVLPGVQHCGGGPGASRFDMLAALSDWVENGQAPVGLVASRTDAVGKCCSRGRSASSPRTRVTMARAVRPTRAASSASCPPSRGRRTDLRGSTAMPSRSAARICARWTWSRTMTLTRTVCRDSASSEWDGPVRRSRRNRLDSPPISSAS